MPAAQERVSAYPWTLLVLRVHEGRFLDVFGGGECKPELLFDGETLERGRNHKMATGAVQQRRHYETRPTRLMTERSLPCWVSSGGSCSPMGVPIDFCLVVLSLPHAGFLLQLIADLFSAVVEVGVNDIAVALRALRHGTCKVRLWLLQIGYLVHRYTVTPRRRLRRNRLWFTRIKVY